MHGNHSGVPIDRFAETVQSRLTSIGRGFFYYSSVAMPIEDLREYVHEPVESLPDKVCEVLRPVELVLVPYLSPPAGGKAPVITDREPPSASRLRSAYMMDEKAVLFFSVKNENPSNYHQIFFNTLAHLLARRVQREMQGSYAQLLLAEMEQRVNGEVDEASWTRKQALPRREQPHPANPNSKAFRDYAAQSFTDTMTLYLHGICCDIDVETGPRQLPSRWLRKRLEGLYEWFPPPAGRPVFPEHLGR